MGEFTIPPGRNLGYCKRPDNYLECRQKLPLAQNQTDLASEAEDPTTGRRLKRKIKPSRHVQMDFESQDPCSPPKKRAFQNLPKAPAISGPSNFRRFIVAQPTQSGCYEVPVTNEEPQGFQLFCVTCWLTNKSS
ncbi:unnamed protein product [Boreogadus saida]